MMPFIGCHGQQEGRVMAGSVAPMSLSQFSEYLCHGLTMDYLHGGDGHEVLHTRAITTP